MGNFGIFVSESCVFSRSTLRSLTSCQIWTFYYFDITNNLGTAMGFYMWTLAISAAFFQACYPMQFSYFGASFGLETLLVNGTLQVHMYYRGINLPCSQSPDEICVALNCSYSRTRAVEDGNYTTNWCLLDGETVIALDTDPLDMKSYGCCWSPYIESSRETESFQFTFSLFADLGKRSDDAAVNAPPQLPLLPVLRVPQNCNATYNLTIYERNGDIINCRYGLQARHECAQCTQHDFVKLHQENCILQYNGFGTNGVYTLELMVDEYPRETILLTHSNGTQTVYSAFEDDFSASSTKSAKCLSSIPMQFAIIVEKAISECAFGIFRPTFVHPTPPNGARIYASNYDEINFTINAFSLNERITTFTVVGPHGLLKSDIWSMDDESVSVNVSWSVGAHTTPKQVPVCFLSTTSSGFQSEPRCIWIVLIEHLFEEQTLAPDLQCLSNAMILTVPRSLVSNLPDKSLQLNDASCNITGNDTHLLLAIPYSGCGTKLLEDKSHYIFTNKIVSRRRNETSEQLERLAIPVLCKLVRSTNGSEQANRLNDTIDKMLGVDTFEIQFSKEFNSSWRPAGPDSPFDASSKDHLYISIIAKSNETAFSLYVESCQMSVDTSSTVVTLLQQGCLNYNMAEEHKTENQKEKVYSVRLSSLPWHTAQVFVTCRVQLCAHMHSSSPCIPGCGFGSGSQAQQSDMQQVSAGPVHITKESNYGLNYAAITVGMSLGGAVVYFVLILLKRSFVRLQYRGPTRSFH
ncbi:uncharacterized protein [Narcine bancroftii]|uniref:uncharacterized protein n=1 Tax=Narcine bancroftii TaxID=1343680 RepID=UPI003831DAFF